MLNFDKTRFKFGKLYIIERQKLGLFTFYDYHFGLIIIWYKDTKCKNEFTTGNIELRYKIVERNKFFGTVRFH